MMTSGVPQKFAALAEQHDHFHMATVIARLPEHIRIALADSLPTLRQTQFSQVVVCGLGGSALPCEVLMDAFAAELTAPMRVWRTYGLPPGIDGNTLLIFSSFSGNTEETLSGIEGLPVDARNVVVVTAGGRLAQLAAERGYPLIVIPTRSEPKGFQPRSAFGFIVTYLARVLHAAGLIKNPAAALGALPAFLSGLDVRGEAADLAAWLGDRIPVVYTDDSHLMSVARIAKIKFNENAKRPSFFNAFPELNHNEMIGFTVPLGTFAALYLHDPGTPSRIRQRFDVMKDVFARDRIDNVAFRAWEMPGATRAERVFAALMFADWCSYYLALLGGFDPTPVPLVESFKQELSRS
jgi:glucose/mannose-6-phosphate isomerase